jgi:putative CocE/NonD family hydrolase
MNDAAASSGQQGRQGLRPRMWIDFDRRVPMRDGVTLSADAYRPDDEARHPVILTRTPYLKNQEPLPERARKYVEAGYAFVVMDVRGRGDSDGEFVPYRNDGRDGYDAIEWCAAQPWSDGNIATLGGSYPGRIQWLAALERPPHLRAMIVLVSPSDAFVEQPTGMESPMHLCWLHYVSGRVNQNMRAVDWMPVYEHLPALTMDERAGRVIRHWRDDLAHTQLDDYWRALSYQDKFDRVDVPVLHISGWYDDEQIGTPLNYAGMVAGAPSEGTRRAQRLLMGPWPHQINSTSKLGEVDFGADAVIDLDGYQLRWLDHHLKGADNGVAQDPPARIFIMGENRWRDEHEWPLARTRFTPFYLHSGGRANSRFGDGTLSPEAPGAEEPDSYSYDPARPAPFITEPLSSQIGGPDDYAAIQRRDDVLVYTTPPLERAVEVTGPVRVTLYAASSAPDTDFTVMLLDVHPNGFAQRLCDSMVRARFRNGMDKPELIEPGQVYEYIIDCWNTAQLFQAGHCIRLQIASSAFPKYDRNLNTGEDIATGTRMQIAEQRIYHDAEHPSHVVLPIILRE